MSYIQQAVSAQLGYTPANKAGDTFTGAVVITTNSQGAPPLISGTSTPFQAVGAAALNASFMFDGVTGNPAIFLRRTPGTINSPTAQPSGEAFSSLSGRSYGATGYSPTAARVIFESTETWTDSAYGSRIIFQAIPTGSNTIAEVARMDGVGLKVASGKTLQLGNAYAAGAPSATGYLTIYDSTGTAYKIPAVAA